MRTHLQSENSREAEGLLRAGYRSSRGITRSNGMKERQREMYAEDGEAGLTGSPAL